MQMAQTLNSSVFSQRYANARFVVTILHNYTRQLLICRLRTPFIATRP